MKHAGTGIPSGRPSWRGAFRNAWKAAGEFLDLHAAEENRRLDEEVRGIASSSLPILVHKRDKLLAAEAPDDLPGTRWRIELERYVDRILWPLLSGDLAKHFEARGHVIREVDGLVSAEAARLAAGPHVPPVTWRVETGWAG
ncbi:MAG: hypothetical protein KGR48_11850 [Alphaproteobacteria bacterium]|nr:hypothetical protein [Alphaproteobacteria bacterium]MBU6474200.1 hypothetical protein [Alphaproteobacteria bacterium]MDE2013410.1 hypothetical protein [Alphaproteobacteria bacterium]MDE2073261.1 hypothetical protein [Alphaproteobacteria bacterium]